MKQPRRRIFVGLEWKVREKIQILKRGEYVKSLEHQICKVKKETVARRPPPRRRYGPKVRMDGGCYTTNPSLGDGTPKVRMDGGCYTMYTMSPSMGGGTPGGTLEVRIVDGGCYYCLTCRLSNIINLYPLQTVLQVTYGLDLVFKLFIDFNTNKQSIPCPVSQNMSHPMLCESFRATDR